MQVDREEHHQFVLALPYNMHGTTVSLCHGLSSGSWGLVGPHLGLTQWLSTFFSFSYRFLWIFICCSLGSTYWPGLVFAFLQLQNSVAHTARSQPHHSEMCNTWGLYCFFFWLFLLPNTTNNTTLNFQLLAATCTSLWLYNLMPNLLGLVGTSWEWLTPGIV